MIHDYALTDRTIGRILMEKASRLGNHPWLRDGDRTFSYAQLHSMTNRYARGFERLGMTKGTHVAVMMPNCAEFFFVIWGLGKLGAVTVPLNTAAKGELLRYFVDQSDSSWLIAGEEWYDRVGEVVDQLPQLTGLLYHGAPPGNAELLAGNGRLVLPLRSAESGNDDPPPLDIVTHRDTHLIMYTSGTTGPSKGVMSPHSQGHAVGRQMAMHMQYRSDDIVYTCLPLFHGNALWYSSYAALWADATLAIAPRFSATTFWSDIERYGATQYNALGAMATILWKLPVSESERRHKLRQCMMVPVPKEMNEAFRDRYGYAITSVYAMTETFAVTIFGPDDPREKAGSAGRMRGYSEIVIADDDDRPLPPGEVGEICVRPLEPGLVMTGYYKMPEATLATMSNLWFHTGDRGYLDEDGYLFFVDRKKEAIRRRGENISAYEVEMIIARHPGVSEVAAIAVKSEVSEDDVMVYIVPKPGVRIDPVELIEYCSNHMAYFMVPRFVGFLDALPKTPSEKIEKYKLQQRAAEERGQLWDREKEGIVVRR